MGSKGSAPPPPNYKPIAESSEKAAQYGYQAAQDDLAFRKQVYAESQPREQQLYNLATQVANQEMGIAGANEQRASQQWQQHQQTFRPLEQQMALESYGSQYMSDQDVAGLQAAIASGDTTAINRYARMGADAAGLQYQQSMDAADARARSLASTESQFARSAAAADINSAYAQQARGLQRMGGQTNQIASMAARLANDQALARVGASNNAYRATYDQERAIARGDEGAKYGMVDRGMGLRAGAASFGRNMPNTAAQAYGLATAAGNSAVANQGQAAVAGLPAASFAAGAYGTQLGAAGLAQQGALGMGGLMNATYGNQISAYNAERQASGAALQGLGTFAGMAYMKSDRRLKKDVELVGTHPLGIGIYEYTIDGRRERGVMADEVEKVRPDAVGVDREGFKMVDYSKLR